VGEPLKRNVMSQLFRAMLSKGRSLRYLFTVIALSLALSCAKNAQQFDYSELTPILKQNDLNVRNDPGRMDVAKIEEADSTLYHPIAGTTLYLESSSPTFDSKDVRPRYWLRVEDYATTELAAKRAAEYVAVGTYERVDKAYPNIDTSKTSVRMWAIARGKRVYALTTDSSFLTYIALPQILRKSISMLAER
jgi:hypothetical protein